MIQVVAWTTVLLGIGVIAFFMFRGITMPSQVETGSGTNMRWASAPSAVTHTLPRADTENLYFTFQVVEHGERVVLGASPGDVICTPYLGCVGAVSASQLHGQILLKANGVNEWCVDEE